jgi:hypothetical protein
MLPVQIAKNEDPDSDIPDQADPRSWRRTGLAES